MEQNTQIKNYEPFYIIKHKDWRTREVTEQAGKKLQEKRITSNKNCVLLVWETAIDWYDVCEIWKHVPANDIESYIMTLPKHIRNKLKSLQISFNSIEHVSNYVQAINDWKI